MESRDSKSIIILLIALLLISFFNIGFTAYHMGNYDKQKENGNARWEQVEERIIEVEERMEKIEQEGR